MIGANRYERTPPVMYGKLLSALSYRPHGQKLRTERDAGGRSGTERDVFGGQ